MYLNRWIFNHFKVLQWNGTLGLGVLGRNHREIISFSRVKLRTLDKTHLFADKVVQAIVVEREPARLPAFVWATLLVKISLAFRIEKSVHQLSFIIWNSEWRRFDAVVKFLGSTKCNTELTIIDDACICSNEKAMIPTVQDRMMTTTWAYS
jgi:hypothetical protein